MAGINSGSPTLPLNSTCVSGTIIPKTRNRRFCQLVAASVFSVSGMTLYLVEGHLMPAHQCQQRLPQIPVFDRFARRSNPAISFPCVDPVLQKRVAYIGTVGKDIDAARLLQSFQSLDYSRQFHAVIRRIRVKSGQLLAGVLIYQQGAPSSTRSYNGWQKNLEIRRSKYVQ